LNTYGEGAWRTCWFIYGTVVLSLAAGSYLILRNNPVEVNLSPIGEEIKPNPNSARVVNKLEWRRVYLSALVWRLGIIYIAFGFSYIIYMTFFIKRLISDGGYTQVAAGNLFMTMGWFSLLCGLLWGAVSDRIGRKFTLVILYLIHTIAFLFFASHSSLLLTFSAILFGLTAWSIPAIMAAACGDLLGPELAPAALGFITLFFGIGQAIGPVVAGKIADAAGSFSPVFWLAAVVAFSGAAGSLWLKNRNS
jgi:MFS family permease